MADEPTSVYVSNLTSNVKSDHLTEIFGKFGKINNVEIQSEKNSANILFQSSKDADKAVYHLNDGKVDGNDLKVDFVLVKRSMREKSSEKESNNNRRDYSRDRSSRRDYSRERGSRRDYSRDRGSRRDYSRDRGSRNGSNFERNRDTRRDDRYRRSRSRSREDRGDRRDRPGNNKMCFDLINKGVCRRGNDCRFSHDIGDARPNGGRRGNSPPRRSYSPPRNRGRSRDRSISRSRSPPRGRVNYPLGVCFDFQKGRCDRSVCKFSHDLAGGDGRGDDRSRGSRYSRSRSPASSRYNFYPKGVCFDFQKGRCDRSVCKFSHDLAGGDGRGDDRSRGSRYSRSRSPYRSNQRYNDRRSRSNSPRNKRYNRDSKSRSRSHSSCSSTSSGSPLRSRSRSPARSRSRSPARSRSRSRSPQVQDFNDNNNVDK
jgi:hypothetical protein